MATTLTAVVTFVTFAALVSISAVHGQSTTTPTPVTDGAILPDGTPVDGVAPARHVVKFRYLPPRATEEHFQFTVQADGHLHMYISTVDYPTYRNATWSSYSGNPVAITARASDTGFCMNSAETPDCTYYVVLLGGWSNVNFTITASASSTVTQLQSGITSWGSVQPARYAYFQAKFTENADLYFAVTPIRGSFKFFISTTSQKPSSTDFMWNTPSRGYTRIIKTTDANYCAPSPSCQYYIAVLGNARYSSTENFGITVQVLNDTLPVQAGIPTEGSLDAPQNAHYRFDANAPPSGHITFTAMASQGYGRMFVGRNGPPNPADPNTFFWSASGSNPLVVLARSGQRGWVNGPTTYFVTLQPRSTDTWIYTLNIAAANETITLRAGIPQYDAVEYSHYSYFKLEFEQPEDIKITVSPLSGDPDLYVSTIQPMPTRQNSTWRSATGSWGSDTVTIKTTDPNYKRGGPYYIGIYGFGRGMNTFTITASHSASVVQLLNGVPQSGTADAGAVAYYSLRVEGTAQNHVTITATPNTGRLNLYVATSGVPSPSNSSSYQWSSLWGTPAVVTVQPGSPGFCFDCTYYMAVEDKLTNNVTFTITAASSNISTTLITGRPQFNSLQRRTYAYYKYYVNQNEDVRVSVTAESGDPDVYISKTDQWPDWMHNDWRGISYGGDSISIRKSDAKFCQQCWLYISVYSLAPVGEVTRYSITASQGNDTLLLNPGQAQTGSLSGTDLRHYRMYVATAKAQLDHVSFIVTPSAGRVKLYVSTTGMPDPEVRSTYSWSDTWGSPVSVAIPSSDAGMCGACTYYVTLQAQSGFQSVNYTIRAITSADQQTIRMGTPVYDAVAGRNYMNYNVFVQSVDTLRIAVSRLSGDPDLFVSMDKRTPTIGDSTWSATRFGSDTVIIAKDDTKFAPKVPGFVYISVYGANTLPASYTLTVTQDKTVTTLIDGVPQTGVVKGSAVAYYRTRIADIARDHITFSVTPSLGHPSLYVSNTGIPDPTNSSSYQWRSAYGNPVSISIHSGEKEFCSGCIFYAAVAQRGTFHANATYSIMVSASDTPTMLSPGVPLFDSVSAGNYANYEVIFVEDGDISVDVSRYDGDPDVCMALSPSPTFEGFNCTWSARSFSGESFTIRRTDPNYRYGIDNPYYIAVYSWGQPASYVITVSQAAVNGTKIATPLLSNVVSSGSVSPGSDRYYKVRIDEEVERIVFKLSPDDGVPTAMYISSVAIPDPKVPTSYNWERSEGFPAIFALARKGDDGFCTGCDYYITISAKNGTSSSFSIEVDTGLTLLQQGTALFDATLLHQYTYYRIELPGEAIGFSLSVTPFQGELGIVVSSSEEKPTLNSTSAFVSHTSFLTVEEGDPRWCVSCTYFVGILGESTCSPGTIPCYSDMADKPVEKFIEYTITQSWFGKVTAPATNLSPGVPQKGQLPRYAYDPKTGAQTGLARFTGPPLKKGADYAILVESQLPVKLEVSVKPFGDTFDPLASMKGTETPMTLVLDSSKWPEDALDQPVYILMTSRYSVTVDYTIRLITWGKTDQNLLQNGVPSYGVASCGKDANPVQYQWADATPGALTQVSVSLLGKSVQDSVELRFARQPGDTKSKATKVLIGVDHDPSSVALVADNWFEVACLAKTGSSDFASFSITKNVGNSATTLERQLSVKAIAGRDAYTVFNAGVGLDALSALTFLLQDVQYWGDENGGGSGGGGNPTPEPSPPPGPVNGTSPTGNTSNTVLATRTHVLQTAPPTNTTGMAVADLCVIVRPGEGQTTLPVKTICQDARKRGDGTISKFSGPPKDMFMAWVGSAKIDVTKLMNQMSPRQADSYISIYTLSLSDTDDISFEITMQATDNPVVIDGNDDEPSKGMSAGAIVGIVAGGLGFVALVVVIVMVLKKKQAASDRAGYNEGYKDLLRA